MGITYEEAVKAQSLCEEQLLQDPNVLSVGVVAETTELGEATGNYVIQVGVSSIEEYRNTLRHGDSMIPKEYILTSEAAGEKHIRISVVKQGEISALLRPPVTESLADATDEIQASVAGNANALRHRPAACGYSIGHPTVTSGTIGLLVTYTEGPDAGKAFILSNNHVLAANNSAYVGDDIVQPGRHDQGVVGADTIAFLHRWVPIDMRGSNFVDAALAEVRGGTSSWSEYVTPFVAKIGYPGECDEAKIGMEVEKSGRTTEYTQGRVMSINTTIKVKYTMGLVTFKNQIQTTSMSKGGDSGSCLFEQKSKRPVGLLFAGSDAASFHNHIGPVMSSLTQPSINFYPGGKQQAFLKTNPLLILRRKYCTSSYALFQQQKIGASGGMSASPLRQSTRLRQVYHTSTPAFLNRAPMAAGNLFPPSIKRGSLLAAVGISSLLSVSKMWQSKSNTAPIAGGSATGKPSQLGPSR